MIVGLGNPGARYRDTPHNLGFRVVDLLADRHGGRWRASRRFRADLATAELAGHEIPLMKPTTYMNLSGEAVGPFVRHHAIEPCRMLVICDDIDLPIGQIRIRRRGSGGSHKGLISIIAALGSEDFPRLRIGIDPGEPIGDLTDYVLTPLWGNAREAITRVCTVAADAVELAVEAGLEQAMSRFNRRDLLAENSSADNDSPATNR